MKRKLYILIAFTLLVGCLKAQTVDEAYARSLSDVLNDIEKQFDIQISYDKKLVDGQILNYADWRIKPWSAEESLKAVLAPFDYTFTMDNEKYKIRRFEYSRTDIEEGKLFLNYLETLYSNKNEWEKRKTELMPCLKQALRLNPLPKKPESKTILTPKRKYNGYTVENFAIETLPGIYVCGSLYKPEKVKGKCPVMLNPNGHSREGRYDESQQKICAMQARMGIIAVNWDLFAWGESSLQFDVALHRSSAAQTMQTLNTIRILDYLFSLKETDSSRIGITGASGGGSMTMVISAIDNRITLSVPVVMLSSHFYGGCPCESGMPIHLCGHRTNNAEIASIFAPKPQLILSDGKDWTSTVPELEFPFIKRIYGFYDTENNVKNIHFPEEGHDYGFSKRKAMYEFVTEHFQLNINSIKDKNGNFDESQATIEKEEIMRAFGPKGENLPNNAIKGKDKLMEILEKELK